MQGISQRGRGNQKDWAEAESKCKKRPKKKAWEKKAELLAGRNKDELEGLKGWEQTS